MQLLYMLPPAILLWKNYGHGTDALVLIIPVLVMASGQLAGGLAWLAISGEDAPDLVATAPVTATRIMRAKVEAVLRAILVVVAPFVLAFAMISIRHALILAAGSALAAISATMIQFWFRAQARRAQFHRRQTSSRIATFAEGFFVGRLGRHSRPLRWWRYSGQRRCRDPDRADAGGNLFRRAKSDGIGDSDLSPTIIFVQRSASRANANPAITLGDACGK